MISAQRNDVIDAYRALLIGMVMCFHFLSRWAPPFFPVNLYHYTGKFSLLWGLGAYGVEVFFVISGLVITMTLVKSHDAFDFAFRRFSRLYPALWVCATITLTVTLLWGPAVMVPTFKNFVLSLTMDAPDLGGVSIDGAYWSLNVELKFYLLIAISYYFLKSKFWVAMAILAPVGYVASLFSYTLGNRLLLAPYMPFFLIGMSAWFAFYAKRPFPAVSTAAAGICCLPFASFPLFTEGELSVVAICVTLGLIALLIGLIASQAHLPLGALPYLGRISYSLYLLHENVGVTLIGLLKGELHLPDLLSAIAAATLCLLLAAGIFHLVEIPAQQWLRKRYHAFRPHLLADPSGA